MTSPSYFLARAIYWRKSCGFIDDSLFLSHSLASSIARLLIASGHINIYPGLFPFVRRRLQTSRQTPRAGRRLRAGFYIMRVHNRDFAFSHRGSRVWAARVMRGRRVINLLVIDLFFFFLSFLPSRMIYEFYWFCWFLFFLIIFYGLIRVFAPGWLM